MNFSTALVVWETLEGKPAQILMRGSDADVKTLVRLWNTANQAVDPKDLKCYEQQLGLFFALADAFHTFRQRQRVHVAG